MLLINYYSLCSQLFNCLVQICNSNEWYYTGYYTDYGYEANYNVTDVSGWGPDYGDPVTYLDTFLPDYSGYVTKSLGIF